MAEYKATHIGKNAVLTFFETEAETPYFSIWVKSQKSTQYNGDDMETAVEKLEHWLTIFENSEDDWDKVLILRLHPTKEKIYTAKSEVVSQVYFKVKPTKTTIPQTSADINAFYISQIEALKSEIEVLKLKQQPEEEDEEEDEEDPTQKTINGVLGALEHPIIAGLLNRMFTSGQPVRNLAGVEENETADRYVQMLFSKGVTIEHLRKLAEMPQNKIAMLLTML